MVIKSQEIASGLYARLNLTDGNSCQIKINTSDWIFPDDQGVDVAVVPFQPHNDPSPRRYDYNVLSIDMFATDESLEDYSIGVGDELQIIGLFTHHSGKRRNNPIVRSGTIAAMPGEPIVDAYGNEFIGYLACMKSIGGLSGSPVFVVWYPLFRSFKAGDKDCAVFLLGLVNGHWDYVNNHPDMDLSGEEIKILNSGIAIITPIQRVHEVTMSVDQRKARRKVDKEIMSSNAPTLDVVADKDSD